MEYRTALTLKAFDTITIPGLGTKIIGAIHQISHYRYQLRLDEKFVESVTVDVVIGNGEQRTPERHDGPWQSRPNTPTNLESVGQMDDVPGATNEYLLAGLEGRPMPLPPSKDNDRPTA